MLTKGANESDSVPSPTRSGSSKDPALPLVTGCELDMMVGGAGRDQAMIGGATAAVVIDWDCVACVRIGVRWMKVVAPGCGSS